VIAAVRSIEALPDALQSPIQIVYLLCGNPMNIFRIIESVRSRGKLPLINIDLLQGFSRDGHAIEYLAFCGAAGIISTHHDALREARAQKLITILRTFAIDSAAVAASLRSLAQSQPDAIELLPAIAAPLIVEKLKSTMPKLQVIAGGLVSSLKEVEKLILAGVDAVSVSKPELWVI
jgi:glycerol uptake operon antiterminator